MEIIFVLVESEEPENVGAAARAMHTMGYNTLRLVRPKADHQGEKALALAHGSQHVLQTAQVYDTLATAIADCDLACAATARHRYEKHHYTSVRDLPDYLQTKGEWLQRIAIVFGSERSGLKSADIDACDLLVTIPQHQLQPSLNLAQAVMVFSYELSAGQTQVQILDQRLNSEPIPPAEYASLKQLLQQLMHRVSLPERYQGYVMRGVARLGREDLYMIHKLRAAFDHALDRSAIEKENP
ncbi:TrmH family RNA methyltransferase [Leptothoe sp. PORK10 BA2]|uniref:TrmH family RNA methyltransferase n=1 Tax=Leptothoe sp. PORK10 BA2 TaxID=3110254 RepID=UPI002B1EDA21|nr:TrmH family RNA methyltransferase [Leptothoe sp. PORK10 BA2]MEA5466815.1 TrmH family RNA methyltransferase [Leptothoe sp. PORK10 BA2]